MKIGLYFGSFNPIHIGHCIIANEAVQTTDLDRVWMVVSPQNPFKPAASLLNEYHRLHLVQLATEENPLIFASDIEFHLPRPSYSIDTITYLHEKHPGHQFSIVMGSDGLRNLANWKNAAVLVKKCPLYVYRRDGFEMTTPLPATIIPIEAPLLQISSTHIREKIKLGKSVRYLVPDKVLEELERYHYYR